MGPYFTRDYGPRWHALILMGFLLGLLLGIAAIAPLVEKAEDAGDLLTPMTAPDSEPIETEVGP